MPKQPGSLADFTFAPYNPREISPDALAGLQSSVETFGDLSGIVWNARTGHLVAGHQRVRALTDAGATFRPATKTKPPRLALDGKDFAVRVVDWDIDTEKAANLTANNPWIAGDFTDAVVEIVDDLRDFDGFDDLHLGDLIEDPTAPDPDGLGDIKPEVPFTEEFGEAQNYVLLVFKNELDWIAARTHFGLESVKCLSSRPGFEHRGIGRVIDGAAYLKTITDALEGSNA